VSPCQIERIEAGLQAGDPHFEVTVAWRCYQQLRSAFTATSLAEGRAIATKVLESFPTCPVAEIAGVQHPLVGVGPQHVDLDVPAARAGCSELVQAARSLGSAMLTSAVDRATGAVELAAGDPGAALAPLRRASSGFRNVEAAYDMALTGILIARARRALGDEEGARLELEASRAILEGLGAVADLAMLDRLVHGREATGDRLLTAREVQVLRLLARGSTNRSIGAELGVSERTVDRHVSNIFAKLGVSSRAAATAFAYELDLL
jgi:DNA-binding CsgD family transcriptional regulator